MAIRSSDIKSYSTRPLVTINISALVENYKHIDKLAGASRVGACVKADAYGLGITPVGRALYGAGCRTFFVAHAGEGKLLRDAIGQKASIYVFSGPAPQDISLYFGAKLKPVINSLSQARDWIKAITGVKHPPYAALHFDTGINRMGIPPNEVDVFARDTEMMTALHVDLIMSHLACGSLQDHPMNMKQMTAFRKTAARMPMVPLSLANTGGIYLGKKFHFKVVRPGIGLYGGVATDQPEKEKTRPVMELHAPVLQIKNILKGETIGYNASFTAKKDMKIAIVSAGYADGLPTACSASDNVTGITARLGQNIVPVVGRISMDYTILDISNTKGFVAQGDKAIFFGSDIEHQAQNANMISYELLTGLGSRCKRVYIKDQA
jgi:alanine racemase